MINFHEAFLFELITAVDNGTLISVKLFNSLQIHIEWIIFQWTCLPYYLLFSIRWSLNFIVLFIFITVHLLQMLFRPIHLMWCRWIIFEYLVVFSYLVIPLSWSLTFIIQNFLISHYSGTKMMWCNAFTIFVHDIVFNFHEVLSCTMAFSLKVQMSILASPCIYELLILC